MKVLESSVGFSDGNGEMVVDVKFTHDGKHYHICEVYDYEMIMVREVGAAKDAPEKNLSELSDLWFIDEHTGLNAQQLKELREKEAKEG